MIHAANILKSREFWRSQKPPLGAQIDWGNPMAKGLIGCWLLNDGPKFSDVTGFQTPLINANVLPVRIGEYLDFNGSTHALKTEGNLRTNSKFLTVGLRWVKDDNDTSAEIFIELTTNWNNNDGSFVVTSNNTAVGREYMGIQDSTTGTKARESYKTYPAATIHNVQYWYNNSTTVGDVGSFANGSTETRTLATNTKDQSSPWAAAQLFIGARNGASLFWNGRIWFIMLWNRIVGLREHQEWNRNPYQFLYLPKARTWFVAPTGGTTHNGEGRTFSFLKSQLDPANVVRPGAGATFGSTVASASASLLIEGSGSTIGLCYAVGSTLREVLGAGYSYAVVRQHAAPEMLILVSGAHTRATAKTNAQAALVILAAGETHGQMRASVTITSVTIILELLRRKSLRLRTSFNAGETGSSFTVTHA